MKRLTFEGNFCDISMCRENPCPYNGLCSQKETWERLKEYEDLEEQGRLITLPCKVGDTMYWLDYNRDACDDCKCYSSFYGMDSMCDMHYELYPCIDPVDDEEHCPKHFVEIVESKPSLFWIVNHLGELGKTVFLTREEAEQALGGADRE